MRWLDRITNLRDVRLKFFSLLKNFPVCCDPHSQRLWHINKAEVDVFLELSCFFDDPTDVGHLISSSSAFSKSSLNIWKFTVLITRSLPFSRQKIAYLDNSGFLPINTLNYIHIFYSVFAKWFFLSKIQL